MQELCYWRTTSQLEVDFIVGDRLAIEVKASSLVQDKHLKGLRALKEEKIKTMKQFIVVSCDTTKRITEDGIEIYPWRQFLEELWKDKVLE